MSIEAKGRPWDQSLYQRIERKGGPHYKSNVSDYVTLERMIEAHELRYADRVEVYGDQTYNGMRITDCVVVLNGGHYMSTGIEATEQERYDSVSVTGSGRQVEDEEDVTDVNPDRPTVTGVDYDLQRLAIEARALADKHRREARLWAIVAATCLLLMVGVLFTPTDWIYYLFEAFR